MAKQLKQQTAPKRIEIDYKKTFVVCAVFFAIFFACFELFILSSQVAEYHSINNTEIKKTSDLLEDN